ARLANADLSDADLRGVNLSSARLANANLSGFDLSSARLANADLRGADLRDANLRSARLANANLSGAKLSGAKLSGFDLRGVNLSDADLRGVNLSSANLRGAELRGANLSDFDFSGFNLSGFDFSRVNLSSANLTAIQALSSNFNSAIFTGACVEDWHINSETNLENVICDYIYLKVHKQERRPSDPKRNFKPGEFAKLVQKSIETVDLIFSDGIDWKALLSSVQDIQVEYGEQNVSIQAIEQKSDGAFVIRLNVPPEADKAGVEESFWQIYNPILQAKDEQLALYGQELEYKRKENTRLLGIIETMAAKEDESLKEVQIKILQAIKQGNCHDSEISDNLSLEIHLVKYYLQDLKDKGFIQATIHAMGYGIPGEKYYSNCQLTYKGQVAVDNPNNLIKEQNMASNINNFNAPVGSVNNQGEQIGVAGVVKGDQIGTQYNSPQEKNLAEAADEIQKLLQQLEQTNPSATEEEKIIYVNDETSPGLKRRTVSALKAGGETAIEEFLDNSYVNVAKAVVQGWMKP
ncbi:MAG: pentapeptide repeat-containing protein, partial [Waterburya sp.]